MCHLRHSKIAIEISNNHGCVAFDQSKPQKNQIFIKWENSLWNIFSMAENKQTPFMSIFMTPHHQIAIFVVWIIQTKFVMTVYVVYRQYELKTWKVTWIQKCKGKKNKNKLDWKLSIESLWPILSTTIWF